MTVTVLMAVLMGALMHASWNVLVKSSPDKMLDTALIHLLCSVVSLPFVFYFGLPSPSAWPFLGLSMVIHLGYYFALAGAYQHGELGLAYPLMRGTAPLLVALSSMALLGEALALQGWLGVALVCCGVLSLGAGAGLVQHRKAVVFALSNAVLIAAYTVVDAQGVRASGDVAPYVALLFALDGWPFALMVFRRRQGQVWGYVHHRWRVALGGAVASIGSYAIALWAMTVAPVAVVAALRETSVLFAAILAAWLLKETWTRSRILGTLSIVTGVVLLRFSPPVPL